MGEALGAHTIQHETAFDRRRENLLAGGPGVAADTGRELEQHVPAVPGGKRIADTVHVSEHHVQGISVVQLEGDHHVGGNLAGDSEQLEGGLRIGHREERGIHVPGSREEFHGRGGDDSERPLRADEQLLQVVAAVVLPQGAEVVPHGPVRKHHFKTKGEIPGHAVPQHVDSARVGGEIAADGAAPFRRQRQREEAIGALSFVLQGLQDAARLAGHREALCIQLPNPPQALEADQDLAPRRHRYRSTAKPGPSALWNDAHAGICADSYDRGDLIGRGWLEEYRGHTPEGPAFVDQVSFKVPGIGEDSGCSDDGLQVPPYGIADLGHHPRTWYCRCLDAWPTEPRLTARGRSRGRSGAVCPGETRVTSARPPADVPRSRHAHTGCCHPA